MLFALLLSRWSTYRPQSRRVPSLGRWGRQGGQVCEMRFARKMRLPELMTTVLGITAIGGEGLGGKGG